MANLKGYKKPGLSIVRVNNTQSAVIFNLADAPLILIKQGYKGAVESHRNLFLILKTCYLFSYTLSH